jgi:serine/threonine protein phosphatase PrpC
VVSDPTTEQTARDEEPVDQVSSEKPLEVPQPDPLETTGPAGEASPPPQPAEPAEAADPIQAADPGEPEPDVPCPACGTMAPAGAMFCEACGSPLTAPPPTAAPEAAAAPAPPARPCVRCGGRVAADGYCEECGSPAMSERDHFECSPSPTVGGVCDRGILHGRNEDAMAVAVEQGVTLLVVCDGVSTAPMSDAASLAACTAALEALTEGAPGGAREVTSQGPARRSDWGVLHQEAARRANEAVLSVPVEQESDAPSCTYVAAVAEGRRVVVGNVGDSRAYWLPDEGNAVRLTVDDSWAQEMIELGAPASQVESSPNAHAITRWLGPDAPEVKPRLDTVTVTTPGWLLLCSDGLWNYCPEADDLGELVRSSAADLGAGTTATAIAGALVAWANAQGGRDNITAVLARLGE